ncbi:MAG: glycosyltransferase family 4 protein, partial [Lentisphaerae bacterium]|nr:glycosyltransferase family 4 protein [Lentisphaerota bacterium]
SEKFIITGELPSAKEVIPCADIFFLSSLYEGMPNVVLEAIEARCAILAMDVGGIRDIFGPENPHLKKMVPSDRNVQTVSMMLLELAGSRELRNRISEYNRNSRLMNFTSTKIMSEYYRLFEKVLRSKKESVKNHN